MDTKPVIKLWLDDCRDHPPGWSRARNIRQAKSFAERYEIEEMSLDHDLGLIDPCGTCQTDAIACQGDPNACFCKCHETLEPTGYEFVKWMCETGKWPNTRPRVHSQNPVGRMNMLALIDRYWFNPKFGELP